MCNNICIRTDFDDVTSLEYMVCEDINKAMAGREFATEEEKINQYWKEYFADRETLSYDLPV